jgi:polar amino acid transport system substrate-binding protein
MKTRNLSCEPQRKKKPHNGIRLQGVCALKIRLFLGGLCGICFAVSCSTTRQRPPSPLLVGTAADYAPLIYQEQGRVVGAEVDLAQMVAARLNRPLQIVLLSRDECVGALLTGEVHVLASGLTLETAKQLRIGFTDAFLQSGQMALCRRADRLRLASMKILKQGGETIGVRKGGTAERLLPRLFPRCEIAYYVDEAAAIRDLLEKKIQLYVDDAPVIWREVAKKDSAVAILPFALSTDLYVWGVRPSDPELERQISGAFEQWRHDGTLRAVLKKWLPIVD